MHCHTLRLRRQPFMQNKWALDGKTCRRELLSGVQSISFAFAALLLFLHSCLMLLPSLRLPIIAEDGFRFPSDSFYEQLIAVPALQHLDLETCPESYV